MQKPKSEWPWSRDGQIMVSIKENASQSTFCSAEWPMKNYFNIQIVLRCLLKFQSTRNKLLLQLLYQFLKLILCSIFKENVEFVML